MTTSTTTVLTVNGSRREVSAEPDTPLLWVLREDLALPGTKFGCGIGMCGACTVHVDGAAMRSCQVPLASLEEGAQIVTIEGLPGEGVPGTADEPGERGLHPVQDAWLEAQVPQCGYCQPGMIMAAAALLRENPTIDAETVRASITNICRCGTYPRVAEAVAAAARALGQS